MVYITQLSVSKRFPTLLSHKPTAELVVVAYRVQPDITLRDPVTVVKRPSRLGEVGFRAVKRLEERADILLVGFLCAATVSATSADGNREGRGGERMAYVANPDL